MTIIVNTETVQNLTSAPYGSLSTGLGVIAVLLLIALLMEQFVAQTISVPLGRKSRAFLAAMVPLTIVLGLQILLQIGRLLGFM
jgi:hypothetical protein